MRATRPQLSCLKIFERERRASSRETSQPTRTGAHCFFPVLATNTTAWFDEGREGECAVHARLPVPVRATHPAYLNRPEQWSTGSRAVCSLATPAAKQSCIRVTCVCSLRLAAAQPSKLDPFFLTSNRAQRLVSAPTPPLPRRSRFAARHFVMPHHHRTPTTMLRLPPHARGIVTSSRDSVSDDLLPWLSSNVSLSSFKYLVYACFA
jgi:hypothetical protein